VDEASMVDLALMAKLVRALPPHAGLILLGDKDQLASVEAGAVLGDICDRGQDAALQVMDSTFPASPAPGSTVAQAAAPSHQKAAMATCIVELRDSFRFQEGSGIGRVSRCVRAGDGAGVLAALRDDAAGDLAWFPIPVPGDLAEVLRPIIIQGFTDYFHAGNVQQRFDAFEHFRILCALRHGPFGVEAVNALVERILLEERLIRPGQWYCGRPLMITHNDYNLKLFNGDVGIVLPEDYPFAASAAMTASSREGAKKSDFTATLALGLKSPREDPDARSSERHLRVFFPSASGPPRKFLPARLPPHETVYAMTVHKSQGSEFDQVLLLLPDRDSPVLTRELIYTGVTRARRKVTIWGRDDVVHMAVARGVERSSGLRDALWGPFAAGP
jgi:exodeoxyribonuclease V alpha subunit